MSVFYDMNNFRNVEFRFGRYSYSKENVTIRSWGERADLDIGSFSSIGRGCTCFLGGNHRTEWSTNYPFGLVNQSVFKSSIPGIEKTYSKTNGSIYIGSDVWLGLDVTIMSGITIGHGAVVGANSVVSRNIEPYTIAAGNPARSIKTRFSSDIIKRFLEIRWWDLDVGLINEIMPYLQAAPTHQTLDSVERIICRHTGVTLF